MDKKTELTNKYLEWLHHEIEEYYGRKCDPKDMYYHNGDIALTFETAWDEALKHQWVNVNDGYPELDKRVLVLTKNKKIAISYRYIPKHTDGTVIGEPEWNGSTNLSKSIIAWMYIPSFDFIFKDNFSIMEQKKEESIKSAWHDINNRDIVMDNNEDIMLLLGNGKIVEYDDEWEEYYSPVIKWAYKKDILK